MTESRLDEFRREVNWNLACGPLAELGLPVTGDDGGCPVVVALEDELLLTLLGRLRAVGGNANLFVRGLGGVRIVSVVDVRCAVGEAAEDLTAPEDSPGPTATVGMFLDYVTHRPGGVVIAALKRAPERSTVARDTRTVEFAGIVS